MQGAGWLLGVAAMAGMLVWAGAGRADGPPGSWREGPLFFPSDDDGQFPVPYFDGEPLRLSDHWIGLECRPVSPALRAQLKLAEEEGLVVAQVVPDAPAAKAGIEQYDVIVEADGKPPKGLQDLIDAVEAAKDKELALKVVRGGKTREVKVKPAKRPETQLPRASAEEDEDPLRDRMKRYYDYFAPDQEGRHPWRFRFWGPGRILPPDAKPEKRLPGNLSVTITRAGDEPAKIVVKRGDEKWEVTEDQLDKLPDDVRGHVERMLGRTPPERGPKTRSYDFDFVPEWPGAVPQWKGWPEGGLEQRMEEMNRRIDELRKSLDDLRERGPRLEDAPQRKDPRPKEEPDKKANKV
jgi:hypothetical protein